MGPRTTLESLRKAAWGLGLSLALRGQEDEAVFRDQYRKLAPRMAEAQRALHDGRTAEAREQAEACLKILPDHFQARFLLARLAYETRDFGVALEHLRISEKALEAWIARADAREAASVPCERADDSLWSTGLEPSSCSTGRQREQDRARRNAEGSPFEGEDRALPARIPAAHHLLHGNILLRLGRPAEAEPRYRQALQVEPGSLPGWTNLIVALHQQGRQAEALAQLRAAEVRGVPIAPALRAQVEAQGPRPAAPEGPRSPNPPRP